ncbi:hypothetical protein SOVF_036860 [Spinacia oleracea]|nr:hypothetical protein SOVF_036860 [Spinacia oleracea]
MASTVSPPPPPPPPDRLSLESIPIVDLRLLSQSELTALSLCSSHAFDLRRCEDVVIPKIDRSVFNESAGSRKQTYSRLRLAPRNASNNLASTTPKPRSTLSHLDADNSRIISLFKTLFDGGNDAGNGDNFSALVPVSVEYSDAFLGGGDGGERKRKRVQKAKSDSTAEAVTTVALVVGEELRNDDEKAPTAEEKEYREKELVNRNGEVVDLAELGRKDDPYGDEIRRRTEGKESPEELLGFIGDLNGIWGSRRKKRKIVDANQFGDVLPNGWKVLIAMKKKQGRAWVFCRRYISPNGRYFVSCKEISSYLLSLTSPEDLKQQITAVQCTEASVVDNKIASENAADLGAKIEHPSLSVTPQFNDYENQQKPLSTPPTIDSEKQLALLTPVHSEEVQAASGLKCHKCSTAFGGKDELLGHLVSCHKRKRRKSGAPVEDDIVMKDGKYECQFCNKVFHERSSYFGHVGMHVKNYVKSIGGSPGLTVTSKQRNSSISVAEVPETVSETVGDVEMDAVPISSVPNILAGSEHISNSSDKKPEAGCEAETHLGNDRVDQDNLSLHAELVNEAAQNYKISADDSSGKHDGTAPNTENIVREVEEAVDFSAMEPDNHSLSEEMYSEISKSSVALVEDDRTCFLSDRGQVDLGYNVADDLFQRESDASESDLLAENEENSSGDQNSKDKSVGLETVEHSCFTEGLEVGDDVELMECTESGHLDLGIDAADEVQHTGSLDEYSNVFYKEEETCGFTANKIELPESPLADSNENSSCSPSGDQPTSEMQNYVGKDFFGMVSETEVDMCSLEDTDATVGVEGCIAQERPESCTALLLKDNNGCGYIANEAQTFSDTEVFQVEQTCRLENSPRCELSNRKGGDPKSAQVMNMNASNLFLTPGSNDSHLAANVITSNDQENSDVSNVLGSFSNFIEDKQEQVPKDILSELSTNKHMRGVSMNTATGVPSTTTQLPELDKVDSSRTNKMIFDFGSIPEMNTRFLSSVQNETVVPQGTSPFSLWGQQTCAVDDSQTRVYGGSRGVADQQRGSDNSSLNLVGLQQPSDVGYNLNKVCMNEQRFGVQHNETGVYRNNNEPRREEIYGGGRGIVQQERASDNNLLNLVGLQQSSDAGFNLNKVHMNEQRYGVQQNESGVYNNKSNETRREGISHGNTLNLAGLQQKFDAGYNLNKPCLNQPSYGMQCNETRAYNSTSDESKQERVTYGNSLSLASVPQTRDTRYGLNKACIQQTCDTGFSLNKGYMGTMQELSKLDELGHSRDRDLMVGFGNGGGRPNQGVATDFLWRATEGNILPGGLMDSSPSQGQSSGSYQAFDFLSDKGGNDLYAANEKFDNMSSFEGLRPTGVEPMEFSFMTTQDSNAQLEHQKVMSFNAQMNQGFGWHHHQKPTSMPNMMTGHVVSTMCVWCGNEFHQDSLGCEMQAGSIGYLCPTCKARMSGQFL